ncbi:MAG: hypothetical protein VR77_02165 [Flavobacteriales bacterium BRH_c54]|nr:MAG: hypothetical protein VR77_02165 [Flavobacteriales bacterium BRH_c54]
MTDIKKHPVPKFSIGDLVVINSYPNTNPLKGDPLHVPPIMVVIGIEVENKNKKTHDNDLGIEIGERIKYNLLWFDNKNSKFESKLLYEKFIMLNKDVKKVNPFNYKTDYKLGCKVEFSTSKIELLKKKSSDSNISTTFKKSKGNYNDNIKNVSSVNTLVTFACPDLIVTGGRSNELKSSHDDFGNKVKTYSEILIKVMWFNPNLQKYSEYELPQECLIKCIN